MEQLAARWVIAFSMVLIGTFSLIRFLPMPAGLPDYVRFLPAESVSDDTPPPEQVTEPQAETTPTPPLPTPTLPATGTTATVTVESANCREKPRPNAGRVAFLYRDQQVEVLGKNNDPINPWWYIKIPDSGGNCWLWGMTAKLNGSEASLPIVP
jgi:hypothetical protein